MSNEKPLKIPRTSEIEETVLEDVIVHLDKIDEPGTGAPFEFDGTNIKAGEDKELDDHFDEYFTKRHFVESSILGIDIYKYSSFPEKKQRYIPLIFRQLYNSTVQHLCDNESSLFLKMNKESFWDKFVPTGDGGFQILPSPLHCLIFTTYFEANLRRFNAFRSYPRLRRHVGEISLRYAVTQDKLMYFDDNFFGPGIIRNARMMSKDKLNRLLLDSASHDWLLNKFNGIESLMTLTMPKVMSVLGIPATFHGSYKSVVFDRPEPLKSIAIQKLGQITSKESKIDVYSLLLQARMVFARGTEFEAEMVVSVGNGNPSGIAD